MLKNLTRTICITKTGSDIKSRSDVRIIVIGAGLAGISAANHLIKHGFWNTIILEATNNFGGRIKSKYFGDVFCELGAKWVAIDTAKHSAYELIRQEAGLQKKLRKHSKQTYINIKGERFDKLPDVMDTIFKKIFNFVEVEKKSKGKFIRELNNAQKYLRAEATKIIESMFKETEKRLAYDIFTNLINEFSSVMGCSLEYINVEHIEKLQMNKNSLYIPNGAENIVCTSGINLDENHIILGKPVGFIKWFESSDFPRVAVCCIDGSLFTADHIICTLPLGVLKIFSKDIFQPMLPAQKADSIKNLGFGCPHKIYIEYEEYKSWFPLSLRPMWSLQETNEVNWTNQIIEISNIPNSEKILEVIIGGSYFEEIEKISDDEVVQKITYILRKLLKDPSIPHPVSILRSNWSSNACFLGGQPYISTKSTPNDIKSLASPIGRDLILLFAGDATILEGFGTIDGARRSGLREAERIIDRYEHLT